MLDKEKVTLKLILLVLGCLSFSGLIIYNVKYPMITEKQAEKISPWILPIGVLITIVTLFFA
jgi:hypothetical protein